MVQTCPPFFICKAATYRKMVPENSTEKWYQILLINPDAPLFANWRIDLETAYMTLINDLRFVFSWARCEKNL